MSSVVTLDSSFKVCNGVKQGGVLSFILFEVYFDCMLGILEQSGVGCHIFHLFVLYDNYVCYIYIYISLFVHEVHILTYVSIQEYNQ